MLKSWLNTRLIYDAPRKVRGSEVALDLPFQRPESTVEWLEISCERYFLVTRIASVYIRSRSVIVICNSIGQQSFRTTTINFYPHSFLIKTIDIIHPLLPESQLISHDSCRDYHRNRNRYFIISTTIERTMPNSFYRLFQLIKREEVIVTILYYSKSSYFDFKMALNFSWHIPVRCGWLGSCDSHSWPYLIKSDLQMHENSVC